MTYPTSELVALVYALLPGFVAAWIFHGLTAHPKPTPFERVVQALIFTALTQAVVYPIGRGFLWIGRTIGSLGVWTQGSSLVAGVVVAVFLGLLFASLANSNRLHDRLNKLKITKRTSYPSEWFSAFNRLPRYVYLHLKDGRRIWGWPEEWPDQPTSGHFVIQHPVWLLNDNRRVPLYLTDRIVLDVNDVRMVEFEKPETEWPSDPTKHQESVTLLTSLQKGSVSSEQRAEPTETDPENSNRKLQRTGSDDGRRCSPVLPELRSPDPGKSTGPQPTATDLSSSTPSEQGREVNDE